ncbi:MAG: hypothetical protein OEV42_02010 [Deltaproteobacteria bacterium]|nr:hypothetical protein [Deltaproteobacteria bacterium]
MNIITDEEKEAFAEFCDLEGSITPAMFYSPDPPDFAKKDGTIVVEVTEYHRDKHYKKGENTKRKTEAKVDEFLSLAKKKFGDKSSARMNAYVHIRNEEWLHDKVKLEQNSTRLAELIIKNQNMRIDLDVWRDLPDIKEYFNYITIYPTPDYEQEMLWQAPEATIIETIPEAVGSSICSKEPNINEYRKFGEKVYLLIYSSHLPCIGLPRIGRASTTGIITNELRNYEFESSFDGVFFMDRSRKELCKLKIRRVACWDRTKSTT